MKKILLTLFLCASVPAFSQNMGVNTDGSSPDASALLDVKGTTKGLLVPRMTAAQRILIPSPATSLIVYQTDGSDGFYFNKGTPASPNWQLLGALGASGSNGLNSLIKTSVASGVNCPSGGSKFEIGTDANNNGVLDAGEVDNSLTTYICNGATGPTGASGATGASGGYGQPVVTVNNTAGSITVDLSGNTSTKFFIIDRAGTGTSYSLNLKLPSSSNYSVGDVITVAFVGSGNATATVTLTMGGVTSFYAREFSSAVDISTTGTSFSTASTLASFKMIKYSATAWYRFN